MFRPDIRALWSLDPDVAFLNHGSFGACPREVLAVQQRLRDAMEREPVDMLMAAWGDLSTAIEAPAGLLGCAPEDTVFVDNATTGVNAVLRSFPLAAGDAVLTTTHAYGAVRNALRFVCDRAGAELIEVPIPFPCPGPEAVVDALSAALDARRPVLAVVDHVTSKTGLVLPIAEICRRFADRGVPVLVDGAHVPGHFPVDVPALGATWYTGNLHKWAFAPKGCAVLHVAKAWHDRTHPVVISHGYGEGLHREFHWQGTRDPTAWLAAPAAVAFLESLGVVALANHNRALAHEGATLLCEAWGTDRPAPASMCANLVTLLPPGDRPGTLAAANALHDQLRAKGIEVPCFDHDGRVWLRISAQAYNELEDYSKLAEALA